MVLPGPSARQIRKYTEQIRGSSRISTDFAGSGNEAPALPQALQALFTITQNGLTLNFQSTSSGPVDSLSWNFGENDRPVAENTSTDAAGSHVYLAAGTYTIRLTVEDVDGRAVSKTQVIVVDAVTAGATTAVALIGDPHLGLNGATSKQAFDSVIAEINADDAVDFVVIMGDLSNADSAEGKTDFAASIAAMSKPYELLRGNHDEKATFAADYGRTYEGSTVVGGFLRVIRIDNSWEETGPLQYISDSAKDHMGRFLPAQMTNLETELTAAESAGQKVLIAMHVSREKRAHPQPGYGMSVADRLNFEAILAAHPGTVLGIVSGHNHRNLAGETDFGVAELSVPNGWGNTDPAGGTVPEFYAGQGGGGSTVGAWTKLAFDPNDLDDFVATQHQIGTTAPVATFTIPTGDATASPNTPPTANFDIVDNGGSYTFNDTSTDGDGTIASWSWDLGDGGTATTQNVATYPLAGGNPGTYNVTLTVVDDDGAASAPVTKQVTISAAGVVSALTVTSTAVESINLDARASTGSITSMTHTITFGHADQAGRVVTISGAPTAAASTATITDSTGLTSAKIVAADLTGTIRNLTIRNIEFTAIGAAVTNHTDMYGDLSIETSVTDGSTTDTDTVTVDDYGLVNITFDHDGTGGAGSTHDPTVTYTTVGTATGHTPSYSWSNSTTDSGTGTVTKAAIGSPGSCTVELFGGIVDDIRMDGDGLTGVLAWSDLKYCRVIEAQSNALTDIELPPNLVRVWLQANAIVDLDLTAAAASLDEVYAYINSIDTIQGVGALERIDTLRIFDNNMTQPQLDAVIDALATRSTIVVDPGTLLDLAGNNAATAYTGVSDNLAAIQGKFTTVNVN